MTPQLVLSTHQVKEKKLRRSNEISTIPTYRQTDKQPGRRTDGQVTDRLTKTICCCCIFNSCKFLYLREKAEDLSSLRVLFLNQVKPWRVLQCVAVAHQQELGIQYQLLSQEMNVCFKWL